MAHRYRKRSKHKHWARWSRMPDMNVHTAANGMYPNLTFPTKYAGSTRYTDTATTDWQRLAYNSFHASTTSLSSSWPLMTIRITFANMHAARIFPTATWKYPKYATARDFPNFAKNPYDADVIEEERDNNFNVYPTATFTPEDWRMYRYTYYRLVEKVDREIGKIIDAIDKNNLWKNTVVIFSSDHGDGIGAHHWNQKSALYEEVVNIPLIVTLPGKKHAGEKLPQLISNGVDFFATICDWTGAEKPESTTGKSFRKIAEEGNPQAPHQDYVITETRFDGSKTRGWMVRTERYKYVLYDKGRHREQLFDMQNDRGETRNLMMENAYAKVAQQHRDILENYMNTYKIKPTRPKLHDVPGKALPKKANSHSSN